MVGVAVVVYGIVSDLPRFAAVTLQRPDAPVSNDRTPRRFTVSPGQSAADIAAALEQQGLIRSAVTFRALVEARGVGGRIEAGEYQLNPAMSTAEIIDVLGRGAARAANSVTIPEGWRKEQIAQRLEASGIGTAQDVLTLIGTGAPAFPDAPLVNAIPPGGSLEGYLFPDTYQIGRGTDPRRMLDQMIRELDKKLAPVIRESASAQGLSVHQLVTLASIVEREASRQSEQPTIASVYLNRLRQDMPLQADPTVQYAVANANPIEAAGFGFWKRELSRDDLRLGSSYNTYVVKGLPPGPICSPGLAALQAVATPAQTDFLFFVARGDGTHAFARTDTEHRANVERYRSQ
ncbi:MAG: endolytic transglycosylase MltG [Chloroflexota bacterium]